MINVDAESNFFKSFVRSAGRGHDGWIERTHRKLERGRQRFGDGAYLKIPLAEMVEEIDEEGQDLGGWSCVTTMGLHDKLSKDTLVCENPGRALMLLSEIATIGAELTPKIDELRELLEND